MARRKHHSTSGRALPLVILAAVIVLGIGAGAFILFRDGGGGAGGKAEEPTPEFAFQVGFVKAVPVEEKPKQRALDEIRDEVAGVLNGLYTTAFVDPAEWGGGSFPSLPSFFTGRAAMQAARDLDHLSLGSLAPTVERVEPANSRLSVSLLIDQEQNPTTAVTEATFRATGRTTDGERFRIFHKGRYWLEPTEGTWRIVGYDVIGEVVPGELRPQPGPTAGATP